MCAMPMLYWWCVQGGGAGAEAYAKRSSGAPWNAGTDIQLPFMPSLGHGGGSGSQVHVCVHIRIIYKNTPRANIYR